MRTLVTGGTGFLGSRLVRRLLERGDSVRVLARPGSDRRALAGLPVDLVDGDVLHEGSVYRALKGCSRLFHVAAVYVVWTPDPKDIIGPAVDGTRAVLRAAMAHGKVDRIVVTSSAAPSVGISDSPETPRDEDSPYSADGADTYVAAKHRAERLALEMAAAHGLPLSVACPPGIFGPGDHKPTPSGENILRFLMGGVPACPAGGLCLADVDDIADGHVAVAERGRVGERYILGGENLTYRRMFEILSDLTGLPAPRFELGRGIGLVGGWLGDAVARLTGIPPMVTYRLARDLVGRYMYFSAEKARRELGYRFRPARETLARSVAYYLVEGRVPEKRRSRMRLGFDPEAVLRSGRPAEGGSS